MTLEEYRKLAQRTSNVETLRLGRFDSKVLHGALGIVSEISEIVNYSDEANRTEEAGDIIWYIAEALTGMNTPFHSLRLYNKLHGLSLCEIGSKLADSVKRIIIYGSQDEDENILECLSAVMSWIINEGINIDEATEKNLNKLYIRFPNKFDSNLALNRNTEKERKVFE